MCKIIGILKIIPQHKNGCLQKGTNGNLAKEIVMKRLRSLVPCAKLLGF
jgi:hypothetical protein